MNNILLLSTNDSGGGAADYIYNIANALYKNSFNVCLVVSHKIRTDMFIKELPFVNKRKNFLVRNFNRLFLKPQIIKSYPQYAFFMGEDESTEYLTADKIIQCVPFTPELIIVGLTYNYVTTKTLLNLHNMLNAKIYLTAYDENAFTGGCHVMFSCEEYKKHCNNCHGLIDSKQNSFVINNFTIRLNNIQKGNFGLFISGGWSAYKASQSPLYKGQKIVEIGQCIDTQLFTNKNRGIAKKIFNIDEDKFTILAGSVNLKDVRKGYSYLLESLIRFHQRLTNIEREKILILLVGQGGNEFTSRIPFSKQYIEHIKDRRLLSLLYQSSDLFVCPSIDDSGPLMTAEAMACGTPIVGFKMGILYDDYYIKNDYNGYVANLKNIDDLAVGIEKVFRLPDCEYSQFSRRVRDTIETISNEKRVVEVISTI